MFSTSTGSFDLYGFVEEDLGLFFELFRILGGEVVRLTIFVAPLLDLRMAHEVVFQALCHVLALGDDADACGQVFQNLRHEQRIMGAAEDVSWSMRFFTK